MPTRFQLTIDCANPDRVARFWATALGYEPAPPPAGYETWTDYWRMVGVPEEELGDGGIDRLVDPKGAGPNVWFQQVPETKTIKNRWHLDILVSDGRSAPIERRKQQVDAEVERLTAAGATTLRVLHEDSIDHYAVVMQDPEGNELCLV
ncbi:MAG: VOC family protein [Frankiaceae bacterium]